MDMFIPLKEMQTKQIFEQTLSLLTIKGPKSASAIFDDIKIIDIASWWSEFLLTAQP